MPDTVLSLGPFLDVLHDSVLIVDSERRIRFANRAVSAVFGHAPAELVGQPLSALVPQRHRDAHDRQVANFHAHGKPTSMVDRPLLHGLHRDGREVAVTISLSNLDLAGERFSIAVVRDATLARRQLGQVLAQAETDALTGLGNRLHLSRCLQGKLHGGGKVFLLADIDLVGFRVIDDSQAHPAGDEVLRVVARRIKSHIREVDTAVRMAGDEFVLLFDGLANGPTARERLLALARHLAEPIHLDREVVQAGVSIGIAAFPLDGRTEAALLEQADRAMVAARRAGQTLAE